MIRTGTFPATQTFSGSIGGPAFYHKALVEFAGASPDRNFSYYIGIAGYNQSPKAVDKFNGDDVVTKFSSVQLRVLVENCGTPKATVGCYANGFGAGPNGYLWAYPLELRPGRVPAATARPSSTCTSAFRTRTGRRMTCRCSRDMSSLTS